MSPSDDLRAGAHGWLGPHCRGLADDGATAGPEKLVALNHPRQHKVPGRLRGAAYVKIDPTHELPVVVYDRDGEVMARVVSGIDAAWYFGGRLTLPLEIVDQLVRAKLAPGAAESGADRPAPVATGQGADALQPALRDELELDSDG